MGKKVQQNNRQKSKAINYQVYIMNWKEVFFCLVKGSVLIGLVSYLFYFSIISFLLMTPYLYYCFKKESKILQKKRMVQLRREFKEGIQALLSALDTGYSVENAFAEACKDLAMIYPEGSYITTEFKRIVYGIRMNKTAEQMLADFGERSGLEEIRNFAEIFTIAKKSGGDLLMIIRSTVQTIREKIEVQNEVETLMAGKRLEQRVMNIIPFGILGYVRLTSGDFLDALYGNLLGITVMSVCLLVYILAVKLAEKIISVEV